MYNIIHIPTGYLWSYMDNSETCFDSSEEADMLFDRSFSIWQEDGANTAFIHIYKNNKFTFRTTDPQNLVGKIKITKEEFEVINI